MWRSSCSGLGCCQSSIPVRLSEYALLFVDIGSKVSPETLKFSKCGYRFPVEESAFVFNSKLLTTNELQLSNGGQVPVVLDWLLGENRCYIERGNSSTYLCISQHSSCIDSIYTYELGYRCACSTGYKGNPHLPNGCQDINECERPEEYHCYGRCLNLPGNFSCTCPSGKEGDPRTQGGCRKRSKQFPIWLGILIGLICTCILSGFSKIAYERAKLLRAKRKCFEENRGLLLQEQINVHREVRFKIFTIEEIEKATDKFNSRRVVGRGGHGLVYKGTLVDNREVAIKRSRIADRTQKKEFAKELYIGSLINHRNIVKILGCLEVEVPLLVYEFVPKGDLFNYIHIKNEPISLDFRLKVAGESAGALAYLHSDASPSILHGDIKSSNILLDEGNAPKVSDFGASLFNIEERVMREQAQGTHGYIDPEYMQTCRMTDKSDVYSFAVMLLEIFTRKKAIVTDESGPITLASAFRSRVEANTFRELLDLEIRDELNDENVEELEKMLARCLRQRGQDRPSMKEVSAFIERLRESFRPSVPFTSAHQLNPSSSFYSDGSTYYRRTVSRAGFNIHSGR